MYVQDYSGNPDEILKAAFANPKLHPKKSPDIETAMRVIGDTVAKASNVKLTEEIDEALQTCVSMYEINNGTSDDIEADERDNYESGMDDAVENVLEPWNNFLSADWLGLNTIDTGLWTSRDDDRSVILALAKRAAKEVFKQLTSERTPAQILANAGFTKPEIEVALAAHLKPSGDEHMATTSDDLSEVIGKIKAYVGKDFDVLAVYDDLDMIMDDDDDILTSSAAGRIGASAEDVEVLQLAGLDLDDGPTELCDMITAHKETPARQNKAKAKAKEATADATNSVASLVLSNLKDCGAGDTSMADAIGVSRSTYTNYIKGKTPFVPDNEQYTVVREALVVRANLMLAAIAALDGTEPTEVA